MGTVWIRDFSGGLDARRMAETVRGNVLIRATNCHVNSGGEVEKRSAITEAYELPEGATKGLAATPNGLVVFGHVATPAGMPSGVTYQRLIDPTNNLALNRVLSVTSNARKLFAVAEFADGGRHMYYDGALVTAVYDGKASGQITVLGGTHGSSQLSTLLINGVAIIGAAVTYTTSNENTATLIAAAINAHTSSPNYTAVASGATVTISAATAGSAPNGFAISYTVASSLSLTPDSGEGEIDGGADDVQVPTYARTIGSKVYTLAGPLLNFSGIRQPARFLSDAVGAGFIDYSAQHEDAQSLKAVHTYQDYIALFAERVVLIWFVDPDPTLNRKVQILSNIGAAAPKSVSPWGDNDLMVLDLSGVRSLRARDSSNAAISTDIGSPIDAPVKAAYAALTTTERDAIVSLTDPLTGRWWLIMKGEAYLFSYFGNSKISAWTRYALVDEDENQLAVTDAVVFNNVIYLRSGDKIYAYGGQSPAYDATEVDMRLPFIDADKPTQVKTWTAIDVACTGRWEISANVNPLTPDEYEVVAVVDHTTYGMRTIPLGANGITGVHISFRFRTTGSTAAKLGAVVAHFTLEKDED